MHSDREWDSSGPKPVSRLYTTEAVVALLIMNVKVAGSAEQFAKMLYETYNLCNLNQRCKQLAYSICIASHLLTHSTWSDNMAPRLQTCGTETGFNYTGCHKNHIHGCSCNWKVITEAPLGAWWVKGDNHQHTCIGDTGHCFSLLRAVCSQGSILIMESHLGRKHGCLHSDCLSGT